MLFFFEDLGSYEPLYCIEGWFCFLEISRREGGRDRKMTTWCMRRGAVTELHGKGNQHLSLFDWRSKVDKQGTRKDEQPSVKLLRQWFCGVQSSAICRSEYGSSGMAASFFSQRHQLSKIQAEQLARNFEQQKVTPLEETQRGHPDIPYLATCLLNFSTEMVCVCVV